MKIKISLGSNINQVENICKAQEYLTNLFPDIYFSPSVWTNPIGIQSDKFLNCIGEFSYSISKDKLISILKKIEQTMGDNHQNHKIGKVIIDIDLCTYGTEIVKPIIWLSKQEKSL